MVLTRHFRPLRLAYIDDNAEDLQTFLESWQQEHMANPLDTYSSAEAFLHSMDAPFASWPDIVLVDLDLPGMGGKKLVRVLKAQPELAHQSIVIITGSDEEEASSLAAATGAEAFAQKPVRAAGIRSAIMRIQRVYPRYRLAIVEAEPPTQAAEVSGV